MMRFWITIFCLLVTAPAWATTRYVDLTLVSDCTSNNYSIASRNCTGADGNAYNTVAEAISPTVSGDTIYLRAGTYTTRITFSGKTFTSPTTLSGYPGDAVTYAPIFSSGTQALTVVSWLVWQDMTVSGANGPDNNTNSVKGIYISGPDNWTLQRLTITGFHYNGIFAEGGVNITIQDNTIHGQVSTTCVSGTRWYGIYIHDGTNVLIRRNDIYNNPGGGIQVYPGPVTGLVVRRNRIHENGTCSTSPVGGMIVATDSSGGNISGVKIYYNEIYGNGPGGTGGDGGGIRLYAQGGRTQVGTEVISNTVYANLANTGTAYGIKVEAGPSGTIVKNNISLANETGQIIDSGTATVSSNNKTTGVITDCTVSTIDFTQKAGSPCIDAGVAVTGYSFNGSAPDQGAYESIVFASCSVEAATPTIINITFTNNANPPLSSAMTGITARADTISKIMSGTGTLVGDSRIDQAVTVAFVAGQAIDISIAASNLTDSALVGNTTNQPFVQTVTNQPCTNNTAGALSHTFTQATFEFHAVQGTEAAPVMKPDGVASTGAAENVSRMEVSKGGKIRVRVALVCGNGPCPDTGFKPYFTRNSAVAGDSVLIPETFGADKVAMCGTSPDPDIPANFTTTTNQLSTPGTFRAGAFLLTNNAVPTVTGLLDTNKTELEICVAFDTDGTANDIYRIYFRQQDGTLLDTYTNVPTITLVGSSGGGGGGFTSLPTQPWGIMATPNPTQGLPRLVGMQAPAGRSSW